MDQDGSTPLMNAAWNGHLLVVEYLLEKGADLNAQDNVNEQLNVDSLLVALVCSLDGVCCALLALVTPTLTERWRLSQRC